MKHMYEISEFVTFFRNIGKSLNISGFKFLYLLLGEKNLFLLPPRARAEWMAVINSNALALLYISVHKL